MQLAKGNMLIGARPKYFKDALVGAIFGIDTENYLKYSISFKETLPR